MMKNHRLAGAVADASMGEALCQLANKCSWYGSELVTADRFFPSSKTCRTCGAINAGLKLSERTFICPECRAVLDWDLNAAQNFC